MAEECNPRRLEKLLKKGLKVLMDRDHAKFFRQLPAPNETWTETYRRTIPNIIDLNTIGLRMGRKGYTHADFIADVQLLYENTKIFNGETHELTLIAKHFVEDATLFVEQHKEVEVMIEMNCRNLQRQKIC